MYMVQLCKEDMTILHMLGCWAIVLHSTQQIVNLSRTHLFVWKSIISGPPLSPKIACQIYQCLHTANKINKCLAIAKCHTPRTKLYIKAAPSEDKNAVTQMTGSHTQQRPPVAATDAALPTLISATKTKVTTTNTDTWGMSLTAIQKNHW